MRYERKYRVEDISLPVVEQVIRQHPASFRPLHPPRWINNLYFDTPAFSAFEDNVVGAPQRLKYRLRWYGRPFHCIRKPVLELKIKDNAVGCKKSTPFPGEFTAADFPELIGRVREASHKGLELQPVLFNTYHRSYWGAPTLPFRITIDSQLRFGAYRPTDDPRLLYEDRAIIVEVKYDEQEDERAAFVLQHLPFRLSKSSKYVTGMNFAYG